MTRIKMPPSKSHRLRKWALIVFTVTAVALIVGGGFLSRYAENQIETRIKAAGASVGDVNVNLLSRTVEISNFDLNPGGADSTNNSPVQAQLKHVTLGGISIYNLLAKKKINIKEVIIADGSVQYNRRNSSPNRKVGQKQSGIKGILISSVRLQNIHATLKKDSLTQCSAILNLILNHVQSSDTAGIGDIRAYVVKDFEAKITDALFNSTNGFYQTRIASVLIASGEEKLKLDSLILSPNYSKFKFSRRAGKQVDRINAFILHLDIMDLKYDQLLDSTFVASKIEINSPELLSFRDKRMAFKETENKPLPIVAIKDLGFGIEVDTVQIRNGKITYEEFPPDGVKSGKIVFESLQATLVNMSNNVYQNKPAFAELDASARIMGRGLIQASFSLPLDGKKPYHAKGKISQMALYHLNPALENLAFIRIESGRLNNLFFDFDYNDRSSNGTLTINYQDLKITGLKKEKSKDESELKTFLINTVVKNDKDKDVPIEKRTGAIEFERDRKRQIFNFWWKSLLSGIKASVLNAKKDDHKSKKSQKK